FSRDWSSDVCSSDLEPSRHHAGFAGLRTDDVSQSRPLPSTIGLCGSDGCSLPQWCALPQNGEAPVGGGKRVDICAGSCRVGITTSCVIWVSGSRIVIFPCPLDTA